MRFAPTQSGGRIASGDTPYGKYHVEWDRDGTLVCESIEIRRPPEHIPASYNPTRERHDCCNPPPDLPY